MDEQFINQFKELVEHDDFLRWSIQYIAHKMWDGGYLQGAEDTEEHCKTQLTKELLKSPSNKPIQYATQIFGFEIKVMKSDHLPEKTMICSPDVIVNLKRNRSIKL